MRFSGQVAPIAALILTHLWGGILSGLGVRSPAFGPDDAPVVFCETLHGSRLSERDSLAVEGQKFSVSTFDPCLLFRLSGSRSCNDVPGGEPGMCRIWRKNAWGGVLGTLQAGRRRISRK